MTQDKLNYLLVLAEERNFTRAAKRLFITQPTLTGFVNRLEREIGFQIFERQTLPVTLTPSGKQYLEQMQRLLREEHELKERLRCEAMSQIRFHIGIGQIHSQIMSPAIAEHLITQHPTLNLQFHESKESLLLDMLRRGEIDLFIGHAHIDSVTYSSGELYTEHMLIFMPDRFLDLTQEEREHYSTTGLYELHPEQLQGLPVISPVSTQGLYLNYMDMVDRFHISPSRIIQTANQVVALRMVARGLGYLYSGDVLYGGALSEFLSPEERQHLIYCSLPGLPNERKLYYAYSPQNGNRELIEECIALLQR